MADTTATIRIVIDVDSRTGQDRIRTVGETTRETTQRISDLNDRIRRTENALSESVGSIDALNDRLEQMERDAEESAKALAEMRTRLEQTEKAAKESGNAMQGFGESMMNAAKYIGGLAAAYLSFQALKAGITAVVETGMNFEKMMTTVQAISGANAQEFVQLSDAAKQMGETTSFSATQAAEALKNLAASGFSTSQSIASLEPVLNLAIAGEYGLAESAELVSDTLTAFKMPVEDAGRLTDVLVKTINIASTDIPLMANSLKYVSGTAQLMGIDIEKTSAVIGVLAQNAIKGETAGTSLNQVFVKMGKAAKELGLSSTAGFDEVMAGVQKAGWSVEKLGEIFGTEQIKTVAAITGNLDMLKKFEADIRASGGSTTVAVKTMTDNLKNSFDNLSSVLESYLIDIYEKFQAPFSRFLQETVDAVTTFLSSLKSSVVSGIESLKDIAGSFTDIFKFTFPEISISDSFLNLGETVSGVLRDIADFVDTDIFKNLGANIISYLKNIGDDVSGAFSTMFSGIDIGEFSIGDTIISAMENVKDFLVSIQPEVSAFFTMFG
ncbi:MAG: phage tail tape measure protein, partial [Burkholderiales bacterium]